VAERTPGWYIDPEHPRAHRYWDGERWEPAWIGGDVPADAPDEQCAEGARSLTDAAASDD
jgi:hypothetical protein